MFWQPLKHSHAIPTGAESQEEDPANRPRPSRRGKPSAGAVQDFSWRFLPCRRSGRAGPPRVPMPAFDSAEAHPQKWNPVAMTPPTIWVIEVCLTRCSRLDGTQPAHSLGLPCILPAGVRRCRGPRGQFLRRGPPVLLPGKAGTALPRSPLRRVISLAWRSLFCQ